MVCTPPLAMNTPANMVPAIRMVRIMTVTLRVLSSDSCSTSSEKSP
jgi:hypothetical protein